MSCFSEVNFVKNYFRNIIICQSYHVFQLLKPHYCVCCLDIIDDTAIEFFTTLRDSLFGDALQLGWWFLTKDVRRKSNEGLITSGQFPLTARRRIFIVGSPYSYHLFVDCLNLSLCLVSSLGDIWNDF